MKNHAASAPGLEAANTCITARAQICFIQTILAALAALMLSACGGGNSGAVPVTNIAPREDNPTGEFEVVGTIRSRILDEISGISSGFENHLLVHNDDGEAVIHAISSTGDLIATVRIRGARNRDWEDLASIRSDDADVLVIGDIGDNLALHKSITVYLVEIPPPDADGFYPREIGVLHKAKLKFPDGARDSEAMAYDPASESLLFLSKRDRPPRLYGISRQLLMSDKKHTLEFLGEIAELRPPTAVELVKDLAGGAWISQPTSMDISADGRQAVILTYRSVYRYQRDNSETWLDAFRRPPVEYLGPPGTRDEAIAFGTEGDSIWVTTETLPAPLFRLVLPAADYPVSIP